MSEKKQEMSVRDSQFTILKENEQDCVSQTDIARYTDREQANYIILAGRGIKQVEQIFRQMSPGTEVKSI